MPIIEVDRLAKEYRLGAIQSLKQTLLNSATRLRGKQVAEHPLFKALDDVSFSIDIRHNRNSFTISTAKAGSAAMQELGSIPQSYYQNRTWPVNVKLTRGHYMLGGLSCIQ